MYGIASGASVSSLFLAGVIPGLMIGLLLMLYAIYHCRRYGEDEKKSMQKSICCMKKGCSGCCAKAFRPLEPGYHPWLYLQRHRLPHGSSGYLRFLCPVCQPVPLPNHDIPGYPADFCGSDPHIHTDPLYSGSFHGIFQSSDPDAGAAGGQQLYPGTFQQPGHDPACHQPVPAYRGNGHGYDPGDPDSYSDPAPDRDGDQHGAAASSV